MFPAVLIGKDYLEAVKVLEEVRPKHIVSNNTGIAYKAFEMGIDWVAGPFLNTTNSYALLTLKEDLNCKVPLSLTRLTNLKFVILNALKTLSCFTVSITLF